MVEVCAAPANNVDIHGEIEGLHSEKVECSDRCEFRKCCRKPGRIWQMMVDSGAFKCLVKNGLRLGTAIGFVAVILPLSLLVAAINLIGLTLLGLASPMLLFEKSRGVWEVAKDRLLGISTELLSLPKVVFLTAEAVEPNATSREKGSGDTVVVLVHGLFHNKSCWHQFTPRLIEETSDCGTPITRENIYEVNYGSPITHESIDLYAQDLAAKLEKIREERGLEKLNVILDGHSMGGLVSAQMALKYATAAGIDVKRIITNGTPWDGSPIAPIASLFSTCCEEMKKGHPFHKELGEAIKNNDNLRGKIYTIASKGDTLVPIASARGDKLKLDESHCTTISFPYGHIPMLAAEDGRRRNIELIKESWEEWRKG